MSRVCTSFDSRIVVRGLSVIPQAHLPRSPPCIARPRCVDPMRRARGPCRCSVSNVSVTLVVIFDTCLYLVHVVQARHFCHVIVVIVTGLMGAPGCHPQRRRWPRVVLFVPAYATRGHAPGYDSPAAPACGPQAGYHAPAGPCQGRVRPQREVRAEGGYHEKASSGEGAQPQSRTHHPE